MMYYRKFHHCDEQPGSFLCYADRYTPGIPATWICEIRTDHTLSSVIVFRHVAVKCPFCEAELK